MIVPALRHAVSGVNSEFAIQQIRSQQEDIDATMRMERALAALTAGFGALALALACVGIYGVMAYSVANRRNEIGIRLALGARPGQVRTMILRESAWLAVAGVVAGVAAALWLGRLVGTMLYGIGPYDPLTLLGGTALLFGVALLAGSIPHGAPPAWSRWMRCAMNDHLSFIRRISGDVPTRPRGTQDDELRFHIEQSVERKSLLA